MHVCDVTYPYISCILRAVTYICICSTSRVVDQGSQWLTIHSSGWPHWHLLPCQLTTIDSQTLLSYMSCCLDIIWMCVSIFPNVMASSVCLYLPCYHDINCMFFFIFCCHDIMCVCFMFSPSFPLQTQLCLQIQFLWKKSQAHIFGLCL